MVFWKPGVSGALAGFAAKELALLPKSDANVRLDQGQHYKTAALMREAAEQKAEKIFIGELSRGFDRKGL